AVRRRSYTAAVILKNLGLCAAFALALLAASTERSQPGCRRYLARKMPVERAKELRRRRGRRKKVAKLRQRYRAIKGEVERTAIVEKLAKVAPGLTLERFLAAGESGRSS